MRIQKKAARMLTALLLCLSLLVSALPGQAYAAKKGDEPVRGTTAPGADPMIPADAEWPELVDEDGYLTDGEFVYESSEAGLWRYLSSSLRVEIVRRATDQPRKLVWYEAEVHARGETWGNAPAVPGKHFSTSRWPYLVTSENGCVLAINGDFACGRFSKKNSSVGILIRDGVIYSARTRPAATKKFPNLDTLALYADGNMEVHDSDELTAQEYLDRGAVNVYAFGPWLIRDGQINPKAGRFGRENAPRTVLGMVTPGHYWAIMLEGRSKDSKGASISWMTDLIASKGVSLAFNMDGGETACMCFMGKQINIVGMANNKAGNARREAEFLYIGTSSLVEGYLGDRSK